MSRKVSPKTSQTSVTPVTPSSPGGLDSRSQASPFENSAQLNLLQTLLSILPSVSSLPEQEKLGAIASALEMLDGLSPTDTAERMLGLQMIAVHHAAIECLRRAHLPDQPTASRDYNLSHALKFLSLYAKQLEALDRRRGKHPPKVTVEAVNVESGGQAVVGVVEGKATQSPPTATAETRAGKSEASAS